jgi:hypothetical protein
MQSNLFDDLKSLKEKISQSEKKEQEAQVVTQKREKELKLHAQFEKFMQTSGVKKLS